MSIVEQMNFCIMIANKLAENVGLHEQERRKSGKPYHGYVPSGRSWTPEMVDKSGYTKTQIQSDIKMLRRELANLEKMFDGYDR